MQLYYIVAIPYIAICEHTYSYVYNNNYNYVNNCYWCMYIYSYIATAYSYILHM